MRRWSNFYQSSPRLYLQSNQSFVLSSVILVMDESLMKLLLVVSETLFSTLSVILERLALFMSGRRLPSSQQFTNICPHRCLGVIYSHLCDLRTTALFVVWPSSDLMNHLCDSSLDFRRLDSVTRCISSNRWKSLLPISSNRWKSLLLIWTWYHLQDWIQKRCDNWLLDRISKLFYLVWFVNISQLR